MDIPEDIKLRIALLIPFSCQNIMLVSKAWCVAATSAEIRHIRQIRTATVALENELVKFHSAFESAKRSGAIVDAMFQLQNARDLFFKAHKKVIIFMDVIAATDYITVGMKTYDSESRRSYVTITNDQSQSIQADHVIRLCSPFDVLDRVLNVLHSSLEDMIQMATSWVAS